MTIANKETRDRLADDGSRAPGWLFEEGSQVDHFRMIRPLGRGGMAEVYLARDTKLGRKVALKVIKPERLGSTEAIERFMFEARATARFSHPNIVTIFAVGEDNSRPYVALEYLEGQSLRQRMNLDRPSHAEILRIGLAIAEALKEAHQGDILHRDLKPENVILARDGRLRVLDFGLAGVLQGDDYDKREDLEESAIHEPDGGQAPGVQGTPAYMAPEQWEEAKPTPAVDIWALGVILYEMVAGKRPYDESSAVKQAARVLGPYPVSPLAEEVPGELAELIMNCLQKAPSARPSAARVVQRISEILVGDQDTGGMDRTPFRGLLSFDEQHRHFFFGRESETAAFVERLRQQPVLPVVGPSGAGKTSFIQAGVVPRLRERGPLTVLQMRPGSDPFLTLASRITSARKLETHFSSNGDNSSMDNDGQGPEDTIDGALGTETHRLARQLEGSPYLLNLVLHRLAEKRHSQVLLFVDQLEELYTMVPEVDIRRSFMQAICSAADDPEMPVRVIFTVREEFLSRLAEGAGVRDVMSRISVLRSPESESLKEILARPVEAVGYSYEDPRMVWEMVGDVEDELSPLPLLQFAGRLLWDRRDEGSRVLKRSVYESMGGVAGALAQHADGVLAGLSAGEVHLARDLLLRLVTPDKTRRVLTRSRLLEGMEDRAGEVLKRLILARLITTRRSETDGEAELELVHESLVASWGRLARWIDESRDELVFLNEVTQAADLWVKRGRRADEVWQGEALREAERAADRCRSDLPSQVKDFLQAGKGKEHRRAWRKRSLVAAAFVAIGILAAVFITKEHETRRQKEAAVHERAVAQREGAAATLMQGNVLEARAKLRASMEAEDSVSSRALWSELKANPLLWKKKLPEVAHYLALSRDGKTAAVSLFGGWVVVIDTRTAEAYRFRPYREGYVFVHFLFDSERLVFITEAAEVGVWNVKKRRSRILGQGGERIMNLSISKNGDQVATIDLGKQVRVWNARTGSGRLIGDEREAQPSSVSFDPEGRVLAVSNTDGSIELWDLQSNQLVKKLGPQAAEKISWLKFDSDDGMLLTGSKAGIRLWNTDSGENRLLTDRKVIRFNCELDRFVWRAENGDLVVQDLRDESRHSTLDDSKDKIVARVFSKKGELFAASNEHHVIRVWDATSGKLIALLKGHGNFVRSLVFDPQNRSLYSAGFDKTVRRWSLSTTEIERPERGHTDQVIGVAFSPDGQRVASGGFDHRVIVWDVQSGRELARMPGHTSTIWKLVYRPDGEQIATAAHDLTLRLWDVKTFSPENHLVLEGHEGAVYAVDYSPDGRLLASGSVDGCVRLWDSKTGEQIKKIEIKAKCKSDIYGKKAAVMDVAFSPDGKRLAVSSTDAHIRLFSVPGATRLAKYEVKETAVSLDFSPDGKLLAFGGEDGKLKIRDLESGQVRELGKHWGWIYQLKFHPDGRRIATASRDDTARIWDLEGGQYAELTGHRSDVNRADFSPDGSLLATVGDDGTLRLWKVNPPGSTLSSGPVWRAPLLLTGNDDSVVAFTHHGWENLDEGKAFEPIANSWRRAVEVARRASVSRNGRTLCVQTLDDALEIWDTRKDRIVWRKSVEDVSEVQAAGQGCAVLAGEGALLLTRDKRSIELGGAASALGWYEAGHELLLVSDGKVLVYEPNGLLKDSHTAGQGVTAVLALEAGDHEDGPLVLVGKQEGSVECVACLSGSTRLRPLAPLRDEARSPVLKMAAGPPGTLAVGYANGEVGLWDIGNGVRLHHAKLHGPILHFLFANDRLYLASELGDTMVWDLSVYKREYCELLSEVREAVPLVWKDGRPVQETRPREHPCLEARAR